MRSVCARVKIESRFCCSSFSGTLLIQFPTFHKPLTHNIYSARPLVTPTRSVSEGVKPFPRLRFGLVWDVSLSEGVKPFPRLRFGLVWDVSLSEGVKQIG